MLKKLLIGLLALFLVNTFLSVLSSCETNSPGPDDGWGPDGGCTKLSCFRADSTWLVPLNVYNANYPEAIGLNSWATAVNVQLTVYRAGTPNTCAKAPAKKAGYSPFAAAYALTPAICPLLHGSDSIEFYNIYSNHDYDAGHPAGSSLNDLFTLTRPPDLVDGQEREIEYKFRINTPPADTGKHAFTIILAERDGDTLVLNAHSIRLRS